MTISCSHSHLHFDAIYTENGWIDNARVQVDARGYLVEINSDNPKPGDTCYEGYAIPGFYNSHSHAFQYAMAGLTETIAPNHKSDDFWTWREQMYRMALSLTPEKLEAVAACLYAEMLRFGITTVCEFHYVHHQVGGRPYKNPTELSESLMRAAQTAGIELCLVPVYYRFSDFNERPASPNQLRFVFASTDQYFTLIESVAKLVETSEDLFYGLGVHSLRAANCEEIIAVLSHTTDRPIHIHIAEQQREVQAAQKALGKRPLHWLVDNIELGVQHNLVHATHINAAELAAVAKSQATITLCPSTEGNLGDGFFPIIDYLSQGGRFAIGSDSHVGLNFMEELRWLDYQQRLHLQRRNPLVGATSAESGELLFRQSWHGGYQTSHARSTELFKPQRPFDCIVLDKQHPLFLAKPIEKILSTLIYAGDPSCFAAILRKAQPVVCNQSHIRQDTIRETYRASFNEAYSEYL